eukprot:1906714-Lingulodinium_polyedra.AAC.1
MPGEGCLARAACQLSILYTGFPCNQSHAVGLRAFGGVRHQRRARRRPPVLRRRFLVDGQRGACNR